MTMPRRCCVRRDDRIGRGEEKPAAGCAVEACGFNAYGGLIADVREALGTGRGR